MFIIEDSVTVKCTTANKNRSAPLL